MFGREGRKPLELHRRPLAQRIADRENARICEPDNVTRIGRLDRFALAGEELHRPRETHVFSAARVANGHVALEFSGANPHEGYAVTVARVHIRLDLKNEAGELIGGGVDQDDIRSAVRTHSSTANNATRRWRRS